MEGEQPQMQQVTTDGGGSNTVLIVIVIIILLVGGYFLFVKNGEKTPAPADENGVNINIDATMPTGSELPADAPDNGAAN